MLIPIEKVSVRFPDRVSNLFIEIAERLLLANGPSSVVCFPGTFEAMPGGMNAEYLIAAKELGWKEIEISN